MRSANADLLSFRHVTTAKTAFYATVENVPNLSSSMKYREGDIKRFIIEVTHLCTCMLHATTGFSNSFLKDKVTLACASSSVQIKISVST